MIKLSLAPQLTNRAAADALVLPVYQASSRSFKVASAVKSFDKWIQKPVELGDFKAIESEMFLMHPSGSKEPRVLLLGLGDQKKITVETLRKSYAALSKFTVKHKIKKLNLVFPKLKGLSQESAIVGVSEGILLSHYVFDRLKSKKREGGLKQCSFVGLEAKYRASVKRTVNICAGVNLARDLVNENADVMNADKLSKIAKGFEKEFKKVTTVVFDKKRIEKENLKLLQAVSRGSAQNPALIMVNYKGAPKSSESTVLVGKGITYDTGGIQLKPRSGSIIHMKCDMGGAAAVFGTLYSAAKLDLPINIVGVIPACENAISDTAYKPGDVYESYLGKTVEIMSTDAEGRLVLADALAYAEEHLSPSHMIDLATLTGGVVASLGNQISGMFSNDEDLAQHLLESAERAGEPLWQLPLYENYKVALKSNIADLKNSASSPGYPAAVVAGLFLQEFIKATPWAHLDIAGTAYIPEPKDYHPTKATGVGVRTILAFLEDLIDTQGEF